MLVSRVERAVPMGANLDSKDSPKLGLPSGICVRFGRDPGSALCHRCRITRARSGVSVERGFPDALVETMAGGARGGGAKLSVLGEQVLAPYREVERQAEAATAERLRWLRGMLRG